MSMIHVQKFLRDNGFDPGKVDGIGGPKTAMAFEALMDSIGLSFSVRATRNNLTLVPETPADQQLLTDAHDLPWMAEALSVLGLHEKTDNAKLIEFLKSDGGIVGDPARFPWCGDLVHTAIRRGLPNEPFSGRVAENPYLAMNWLDFGMHCDPCPGAILSFWRGSPDSIYGHVGFYWGEDDGFYYILGGNQDNKVSITKIAKGRLRKMGSRWPVSTKVKPGLPHYMTADVAITFNEV